MGKAKEKYPRQYSLCKLRKGYEEYINIFNDDTFIFLGEIPNMKGHCVFLCHNTRQIFSGFHIENFVEMTEDEV